LSTPVSRTGVTAPLHREIMGVIKRRIVEQRRAAAACYLPGRPPVAIL